jgi:hypothetical protein
MTDFTSAFSSFRSILEYFHTHAPAGCLKSTPSQSTSVGLPPSLSALRGTMFDPFVNRENPLILLFQPKLLVEI